MRLLRVVKEGGGRDGLTGVAAAEFVHESIEPFFSHDRPQLGQDEDAFAGGDFVPGVGPQVGVDFAQGEILAAAAGDGGQVMRGRHKKSQRSRSRSRTLNLPPAARAVMAFSWATIRSKSANAAASQISASDAGKIVPCHVGLLIHSDSRSFTTSILARSAGLTRSVGRRGRWVGVQHGPVVGYQGVNLRETCARSASVGSQVSPSGGPNFAQVLSSRAIFVVVNFASSE